MLIAVRFQCQIWSLEISQLKAHREQALSSVVWAVRSSLGPVRLQIRLLWPLAAVMRHVLKRG